MDLNATFNDSLIKDWLQHIKDVNKEQELIITNGSKFFIPFMAIPTPIVKTIFTICDYYDVGLRTKYLALYIFEKFMCNQFWNIFTLNEYKSSVEDWKRDCEKVSKCAKLRLMSSIQLASKMDSCGTCLSIWQVLSALSWLDPNQPYTRSNIITSEFTVYQTINFKIPLVTSLDCIEVLMAALDLQHIPKFYDTAVGILDLAYILHQQLFSQLQFMAHGSIAKTKSQKIKFMAIESNTLLLSGAIVVATFSILGSKSSVITSLSWKLEKLIKIDRDNILTMVKMLLALVIPTDIAKIKV